ncbi:hypothetical protein RCH18_001379 [Flavobacterium sp. PL11]|nr:hypothetical protein [Flavobacterium sp. PL11]
MSTAEVTTASVCNNQVKSSKIILDLESKR